MRTYIGLGSNLANPIKQIEQALQSLKELPASQFVRVSSLYTSKPYGPITDQPDFINAVAALDTELTPTALLNYLKEIEIKQLRLSEQRWGPRTLDLDILLYGQQIIKTIELIIPHRELSKRNFVLYPLAEIAPFLMLPTGQSMQELLLTCSAEGLEILESVFK